MGNGANRITKQKWYKINDKAMELFLDSNKIDKDEQYYYINHNGEWEYINNKDLLMSFIDIKKARIASTFKEDKLFKTVKIGFLCNNEYKTTDYICENQKYIRKINKKTYEDKKYLKKLYNDKNALKNVIDKNKNDKNKNDYYYFDMNKNEEILIKNRIKFSNEVNSAFSTIRKNIEKEIYKLTNISAKKITIKPEEIKLLYDVITKYNLSKEKLGCGKINLIDEKSNYSMQPTKPNVQLSTKIIEIIHSENQEEFEEFVNDYFNTKYKILINTLGLRFSKSNKIEAPIYFTDNIFNIESFSEDFDKYYDEYIKKFNSDNKTIYDDIEEIKGKNADSNNVAIFKVIRKHYSENVSKLDFQCKKRCYFIKHIHAYFLGRARKIKYKMSEAEKRKREDSKFNLKDLSTHINEHILKDTEKLKEKIKNSIKDKLLYQVTSNNMMKRYDFVNPSEIENQLLKLFNTFRSKLNLFVYEAVDKGIAEISVDKDIFSAKDINSLKNKIEKLESEDYLQYRSLTFNDYKDHIIGAYLLRNFTLHSQKFDKKSLENNNEKKLVIEYVGTFDEKIQEQSKDYQEKRAKLEIEKLKFNNVFKYIDNELIDFVVNNIEFNNSKPTYLPRFSKIYKDLGIVKYITNQSNNEKIEFNEEIKQSIFYIIKIYYENGFAKYYKENKNKIYEKIKSQKKLLKLSTIEYIAKCSKEIEEINNQLKKNKVNEQKLNKKKENYKINIENNLKDLKKLNKISEDITIVRDKEQFFEMITNFINATEDVENKAKEIAKLANQIKNFTDAKFLNTIKEINNIGFYEYRQNEVIKKQGNEQAIKNFEIGYNKLISALLRNVFLINYKDNVVVLEKDKENIDLSTSYAEKKINNKVAEQKLELCDIFSRSIYSATIFGNIDLISKLRQDINRFYCLYNSLKTKYSKSYSNDFDEITSKILKYDCYGENLFEDLEKLYNYLEVDITLYNYELNLNKNFTTIHYVTDLPDEILRIYNVGEETQYTDLKEIKYKNGNDEVQLFQQGKSKDNDSGIIENSFVRAEYKKRTLKYLVNNHISALKKCNLNYEKIFEKIEKYYNPPEKNECIELIEFYKSKEIEMDFKCCYNLIEFYMKLRSTFYKWLRDNHYTNLAIPDDIKEKMKYVVNEINKYNFYYKLATLQQLQVNKNILRDFSNRMFAWIYQGEKTGANIKGEYIGKNESFKILESLMSKPVENMTTNNLRNYISHLNHYQENIDCPDNQRVRDIKSVNYLYNEFENFNSYDVKKRNEVQTIQNKIFNKYCLKFNNDNKKNEIIKTDILTISGYKSNNSNTKIDIIKFDKVCKMEIKYLNEILKYEIAPDA